jgi:hypothetical protein
MEFSLWEAIFGCAAPPTAEETDPRQWWVPAEVGSRSRTHDTPRHSCSAQGTDKWPGTDRFERGTSKWRKIKKRRRVQPKCNNSITGRGRKERLCLESKETLHKAVRQTLELKMEKPIVESSIRLCGGGRAPTKRKKGMQTAQEPETREHRHFRNFCPTDQVAEKWKHCTLEELITYQGLALDDRS